MEVYQIREIILQQSKRANIGHIGSALSIADIIAVLYQNILRNTKPHDAERDRLILSKGHAALALYAALFLKGWISEKELNTFCQDDSLLGVHPESVLPGIDFSTGSLGHGLSIGAGAALAARLQDSLRRVFVVMSDGECNEGSVWEAAMFASHHCLANLVAIIDFNGQQAFGYTKDVLSQHAVVERWHAFGWDVHEVDGHNTRQMVDVLQNLDWEKGLPHLIIAHTIFGKGVSYMENQIKWHYFPMSDEEYAQALMEVRKLEGKV
jgi:transketolase